MHNHVIFRRCSSPAKKNKYEAVNEEHQRRRRNKAEYWIRYFRYFEGQTNAKTNIFWQTARQNDYVLIKDQIKSSGFKLVETGNYEETIYSTYRKGKIEVQLYSGNTKNGFGDITSTYEINVSILR